MELATLKERYAVAQKALASFQEAIDLMGEHQKALTVSHTLDILTSLKRDDSD
jgi:outer membrane protein TolC